MEKRINYFEMHLNQDVNHDIQNIENLTEEDNKKTSLSLITAREKVKYQIFARY